MVGRGYQKYGFFRGCNCLGQNDKQTGGWMDEQTKQKPPQLPMRPYMYGQKQKSQTSRQAIFIVSFLIY